MKKRIPILLSLIFLVNPAYALVKLSAINNGGAVNVSTDQVVAVRNGATDELVTLPALGTVTSVSVTSANGVSGTVAAATTTPAISLTLGAITPSTVNGVAISGSSTPALAVTGATSVSGSNTGDQTITLTGGVTGSGTGSFAATVMTNANLTGPITSSGNATSIASQTGTGSTFAMSASPAFTGSVGAVNIQPSGQILSSYAGAASNASIWIRAGIYASGTGTTNFPQWLSQSSGAAAVTTWSTAGTYHGDNSNTGFTGNFFDEHVNGGASVWKLDYTGTQTLIDAANIAVGTSTGTKIGTATSQKIGFFNATPVVQQTGDIGTSLSNLGLVTSGTLASSSITGNNVTSIIAGTGLSGGTITSTGTISSNAVYQIPFSPGLLTSVANTIAMFGKVGKASTVDNIEGSAYTFSCVSNPTITMYECGTSATCTSPTTIGSVTVTAAGQAFDGTVSSAAITAGDYVAWAITAGTCTSLDISATAQVHSN